MKATLAVTVGLLAARVARRGRATTRHVILAATSSRPPASGWGVEARGSKLEALSNSSY